MVTCMTFSIPFIFSQHLIILPIALKKYNNNKIYNVVKKTYKAKVVIRCATHQRKNIKINNISNLLGRYRSPLFLFSYLQHKFKKGINQTNKILFHVDR